LEILERRVKDPEMIWLLKEIVGSFTSDALRAKGLPIGNLTSQLFANVYMNEFDQFVKHTLRVKHYARYTDDFVIVSADEAQLKTLLPAMEDFLREKLRLTLHPEKVQIVKYRKGVDFLGYVQFPHYRLMREKSKQRMMRKLDGAAYRHRLGDLDDASITATLQSYLGVLSHADAYKLSERLKNQFWV